MANLLEEENKMNWNSSLSGKLRRSYYRRIKRTEYSLRLFALTLVSRGVAKFVAKMITLNQFVIQN